MAKFRRRARRSRGFFGRSRSRRSSSGSMAMSVPKAAMYGAMYGAIRGYIANMIAPVTNKIPLGGISDEVGMIGLSWAADKFGGGNKLIKIGSRVSAFTEGASIGQAVVTGQVNLQNLGAGNNSNLQNVNY